MPPRKKSAADTADTGDTPDTGATTDSDLGYEQAREELVDVVRRLESGGTTLEESLALWERGERLATICQARLDGARARLDEVVRTSASRPGSASD